ncbi:MAG: DUF2088 domain-containing protein [Acidobacteria bacterium]|nr:DUF2088 domain-containing protein [Acidobacteriota bacterium]
MQDCFPRMMQVRQRFSKSPPLDIRAVIEQGFRSQGIGERVKQGSRIAVAVGSRGIRNLDKIVSCLLELLQAAGSKPFIVPAMGSHGGATPEGQTELLATFGITEQKLGVPVKASMEVKSLGRTEDGIETWFSTEALGADGIIVVNRVKPHTDFEASIGSGILKMISIGLGKHAGAATCHARSARLGHERVIRTVSQLIIHSLHSAHSAPILCGVAILEDAVHETAQIEFLKPEEMESREEQLHARAKALMPKLPFDQIDLLIVDRIGKNISGTGMDPNIIGRHVQGYSASLSGGGQGRPHISRIFVRELTPETRGNAIGIGLADLTTTRMVQAMDKPTTYINVLTALTPQNAKIPIHFDTDREAISQGLVSLALPEGVEPKVVRIADTLSLEHLAVSEAYADLLGKEEKLQAQGDWEAMKFDSSGNLPPLGS